jgi:hypothetical protein
VSADPGTEEVSRHLLGAGTGQIWLCIRMGNLDPVIDKKVNMHFSTFTNVRQICMLLTFFV